MRFPPNFLDDIRNRLRLSDIIRKNVTLRSNGREFTGLCPFHKEKTPSFTVSDEKGFYHCFGCGAHGDVIKFVIEVEGLAFTDAVEMLAGQAGLAIPKMTAEEVAKEKQTASLYDVMEIACQWFEQQLSTNQAVEARDYLNRRGIRKQQIAKFRIGFVPNNRSDLKKYLEAKGITTAMLLAAGLVIKNERGDIYDRFRGRIIFPIIDIKNRVIAFGGRILGDGQPKYLNSPETSLFKKGEVLYNENNARKLAFKTDRLVVTEGYMDVIALDGAGIKVAVAPLGTAITESHIRRLWSMIKEPVICLDGDAAGQRAMERAANTCLPILQPGYTLKFASLLEGMDPDDLIKKAGIGQMRKVLQKAKPLSEVIWDIELSKNDIKTPEKKADLEKRLDNIVSRIGNATVANYYKSYFKEQLWNINKIKNNKTDQNKKLTAIDLLSEDIKILHEYEKVILLLIINYPELLTDPKVQEEFENIEFSSNKLDKLYRAILEVWHIKEVISKDDIKLHLENSGLDPNIVSLDLGSLFISKNDKIENILTRWQYNLNLHNLINLKSECQFIENQMTELSEQKANEFKKQISKLEIEIASMEQAFEEENI